MSRNRLFREIADKLPQVPKYDDKGRILYKIVKKQVLGSEILKNNPAATIETKEGIVLPVQMFEKYLANTKVAVMADHFEGLQYFYRTHGAEGVNRYIDKCFAYHKLKKPAELIFVDTKIVNLNQSK